MVVLWVGKVLMIAVRMICGPAYLEVIKEIDRDLAKVIKDFNCAMNFEALHLANETSKLSFSQFVEN